VSTLPTDPFPQSPHLSQFSQFPQPQYVHEEAR
jgi:hypothetical protein